jgi:EAL domain-containing protein (putative c-di-GMP-specific phosphodiesterase class I)
VKDDEIYSRPDQFIPVAELTGQIVKIGNWITDEVFRINKVLRSEGIETKLSFNVSPVQLNNNSFIEHLEKVVANNDIEIDLVAEITESHIVDNENEATDILDRIKKLGIKIALDDFGTGYSSLSHLSRIPLDYLKIDKSFIDDIDTDSQNLTSHILSISKTIKLQTVAEGIERIEQARKLSTFGCDLYQGYLFSKPIRVSEFITIGQVRSF